MQLKNYIALTLVVIFLGKLLTMDAKFYGTFLESKGVTMVNKMCSKPQLKTAKEDIAPASLNQGLEMEFLCHTVFDQTIAEWAVALNEDNFREYSYQTPGLFRTPRDKFYPPPKV
ncbi:hypothetical protein SAMN04488034_103184 [Salinimicrobium catena]|uniref:Uncharacterized protein n=1 Tax=Salinimicrobium catena TaxID=390640 RepID=A0A1H5MZQ8_9FLAO|nr:hypothetical protein [Salinimicrobium catena]SDL32097.1 hypothetical protein SAMN04488140_103184 [Salinimicrobium catena]SEE94111.1 hypothetical protein SAMN04488034_103184 [Salinimicrobium catena]